MIAVMSGASTSGADRWRPAPRHSCSARRWPRDATECRRPDRSRLGKAAPCALESLRSRLQHRAAGQNLHFGEKRPRRLRRGVRRALAASAPSWRRRDLDPRGRAILRRPKPGDMRDSMISAPLPASQEHVEAAAIGGVRARRRLGRGPSQPPLSWIDRWRRRRQHGGAAVCGARRSGDASASISGWPSRGQPLGDCGFPLGRMVRADAAARRPDARRFVTPARSIRTSAARRSP